MNGQNAAPIAACGDISPIDSEDAGGDSADEDEPCHCLASLRSTAAACCGTTWWRLRRA